MAFRPPHQHPDDSSEPQNSAPFTMSPTVHLPLHSAHQRLTDDVELWSQQAAYPGIIPDAVDISSAHFILSAGTDGFWSPAPRDESLQGDWNREEPLPATSNSDFLLFEPLQDSPFAFDIPPGLSPTALDDAAHAAFASSVNGISPTPGPIPVADGKEDGMPASSTHESSALTQKSLYAICLTITTALEKQIQESTLLPTRERTPETIEIIRHLALQYLRNNLNIAENIPTATDAERVLGIIIDEILGYGPIDPLLRDETISEIMVSGPDMTYVEQGGRFYEVPIHFRDQDHLMSTIYKFLTPLGLKVTPQSPIADGRMPDGTRVNVVIPPSAQNGPTMTIRRFLKRTYSLEQLVRNDMLTLHMADFIRLCVTARLNIIISGAAGVGKTTILNALANTIDDEERIVTIEDTSELQLHHRHVIRFEASSTISANKEVTTGELLLNALRMRPQRIILNECHLSDTFGFIQALQSGYDGSITTIYANSPRDSLNRIEALAVASDAGITPVALRHQLATGIDIIIHCARLRDGSRRVTNITEVVGIDGSTVITQDLFLFREMGVDMATGRIKGDFTATGARPNFANRLEESQARVFPPQYFTRGA